MLNKNDLPIVEENINKIIRLISHYGCVNSPDMNRLKLIQKNLNIFQECNEGLDELLSYIAEDWDAAMRSQKNLIDCYIPGQDIDLKAKNNMELEECLGNLDRLFETNWSSKRNWYTKQDLIEFGNLDTNDVVWNRNFSYVVGERELCKSQLAEISDETWTYAKYLSVAPTDEGLMKWFRGDIPAFGYISLLDMAGLENGEQVVRYFLSNVPLAFPC